jgi:very-short-patch-repair endonuclease
MSDVEGERRLYCVIRYWKRCLESEDMLGVELSPLARTRSCISRLAEDPFVFVASDAEIDCSKDHRLEQLASRVALADGELYYGYPILLYRDEQNGMARIAPLLVLKMEIRRLSGRFVITPNEPIAELGTNAVGRLGLRSEEAASIASEVAQILATSAQAPFDRALAVLDSISREASLNIVEPIDPRRLTAQQGLPRSGNLGLYNKAVFFEGQNTAFNRALLEDLNELASAPSICSTALSYLLADGDHSRTRAQRSAPVLVFEANEYQIAGLQRVLENRLSVVTGPPGTGKSQFISNLLLNLLSRGKTALFVSHTNEAVQVVHDKISQGFISVLLRTGNKENRQELPGRFRTLMDELERRTSVAGFAEDELGSYWSKIIELREQLLELGRRQRTAEEPIQNYTRYAERLGSPDLVRGLMDDVTSGFSRVRKDYDRTLRIRSILEHEAHGIKAIMARLFRGLVYQIARRRLARLSSRLPSMFWKLAGHTDANNGFQDLSDKRLDLIGLALEVYDSYRVYLKAYRGVQALPSREWILSEIERRMADYARQSRQFMLWKLSTVLNSRSRSIGHASGFLSHVAQARSGDPEIELSEAVRGLLPLWACTLKSLRRTFPLRPGLFDYVIFDEASQVDMPSAAAALYRAKNVVVVGDPMQLTHISTLTNQTEQMIAREVGVVQDKDMYLTRIRYDRVSLYRSAEASLQARPLLLAQHYRSHLQIISLCNQVFYAGRLNVLTLVDESQWPSELPVGLIWTDCSGSAKKHEAGSRYNMEEVDQVLQLVQFVVSALGRTSFSIGIVTPFSMQRNIIVKRVQAALGQEVMDRHDMKVLTAHQFQGSEKDIMIFSLVVAGQGDGGSDKWFDFYPQILNVALSRARRLLYIVGDHHYCVNRQGYLGKIASTYDRIKQKADVEEQSLLGRFDTEEERLLYTHLNEIPELREGYSLQPKKLAGPFTLDIAITGPRKIDIECDGSQHEVVDGLPVATDVRRDQYLSDKGWRVLRFPNYRVLAETPEIVEEVKAVIARG